MSKNPNVSNIKDYELIYCLELGRESLATTRPCTAAISELQKIISVKNLNAIIISKRHFLNGRINNSVNFYRIPLKIFGEYS